MIIDVPRKDAEGNLLFTVTLNEEQTQAILQFGLNFLCTAGLASMYGVEVIPVENIPPAQLDD